MVIRLLELISVEKACSLRVEALGVPTSSPETMPEQHKPRWEWLINAWLLLKNSVPTFLNSAQVFSASALSFQPWKENMQQIESNREVNLMSKM